MKLLLGLIALALLAVSLIADYKWKQWIAARKQDRAQDHNHDHTQDDPHQK
jgi:hypothetical protein